MEQELELVVGTANKVLIDIIPVEEKPNAIILPGAPPVLSNRAVVVLTSAADNTGAVPSVGEGDTVIFLNFGELYAMRHKGRDCHLISEHDILAKVK